MTDEQKNQLKKYESLAQVYIDLLHQKHFLLYNKREELKALFTTKIGCWQVERIALQLEIKSLKLKIELIESVVGSQQEVNINHVEIAVAAELANAERKILKEISKVQNGKRILKKSKAAGTDEKIKKVYDQLARYLHPGINEGLSRQISNVWKHLQEAFEKNDTEKFKAILIIHQNEITEAIRCQKQLICIELPKQMENLRSEIEKTGFEIRNLRNDFPFSIEDKLKDEDWVNAELERINTELDDLKEFENELRTMYMNLVVTL